MIQAEVVDVLERLEAVEAEWWRLWQRSTAATVFQTPAWLLSWYRTFHPGRLATVLAWSEGRLVGLAPLYREEATRRLLVLGSGISDHLDVLLDPERSAEAGAAMLDALGALGDWDVLVLDELGPGAAALSIAIPDGWREEASDRSACPVVSLGGGSGAACPIPAGKRRKLRMARHRSERRGAAVERADASSASDHLRTLFRLHAARWESRGEPGVLADPRIRAFHRATLPGLVARSLLVSYVWRAGDTVGGVFYGFRAHGRVSAYLGGFDPDFAFESPGTVLIGRAIEDALGEGATAFSFLRGREPYKYEWGAVDRISRCRLLRRS